MSTGTARVVRVSVGSRHPYFESPPGGALGGSGKRGRDIILLAYCFIASIAPVLALLQPRDYLSSFLLCASIVGGFIGILIGGVPAEPRPALDREGRSRYNRGA